jgi:UDP-glucose 4-epimerase
VKVLVTGAAGFIAGYLIDELLQRGYDVVGLDNHSKYGAVEKSYQHHPRYEFVEGNATDVALMKRLVRPCDHLIALAARIGGISYFHEYAYDLLAENERIMAATFDTAIDAFRSGRLKKITVLSSSMVFENATQFPTPEEHLKRCPPPLSTYGFQKLACEYFAKGAWEQYKLPFTIVRPFNCVGIGEQRALGSKSVPSGNVTLAMSHVVPDLVQKIVRGQTPLHILGQGNQVRHYTYGGDLARGIRIAMEHPAALNEDFNLSTSVATSVRELAELIWKRLRGTEPFQMVSDPAYPHDVQYRSPDVSKAARLLGFQATTTLDQMLDEVIPWIERAIREGQI